MPRYDKAGPLGGTFRARLAADLTFDANGEFGVRAMSLNGTGRAVVGTAGQSGYVGVVVKNVPLTPGMGNIGGSVASGAWMGGKAGDVVDIMKEGEIVDVPGLAAGTKYYANADGTLGTTNTNPYVGHTVEADRLIVNSG